MRKNNLIIRLQEIIRYYDEIIVALCFAILLGFINSIMDAQMLGGTYFQNMLQPNLYQILERLVFIVVALLFGLLWHRTNKERKEKDRQICESEIKYRCLAETAADGIISIDESNNIDFINKAAKDLFGYSEDEILGEDVTVLMPFEYRHRHNGGLKRYLETKKPTIIGKTVEFEGLKKDGTKFPLELSLSVSELYTGSTFIAIIRDVTKIEKPRKFPFIELDLISQIPILDGKIIGGDPNTEFSIHETVVEPDSKEGNIRLFKEIIERFGVHPKIVSFRWLIQEFNKRLASDKDRRELQKYLTEDLKERFTYPIEYVLFDAILAWFDKDVIDAMLFEDMAYHLMEYNADLHLLLQVMIRQMRPTDLDAKRFAVRLGNMIKPGSAFAYKGRYTPKYKERWIKFDEAAKDLD